MILVLGGTSDSIEVCNLLNQYNVDYIVSVTTEYGKELAEKCTNNVLLKKLSINDMIDIIDRKSVV